ncbi:uncharacterized protein LAESUDRAFT_759241 [Laetiporus sulphureus 93-53]|uniref:Uncharacterized protein n=1 Tax=Laetiporus sulphureus 93-53 TaxID=1314785 RepID=A0A165ECS0_9APHY|nr:uncharacterized protein LAESUDRAFT_759241 [Laetiporus sulphureus 93-53]KZT06747.1 hypothetical protein LAESUDRAFT_759241 [Laetiporus sulphureus 93-53]
MTADHGDFDKLSEGRTYTCNHFLMAYVEDDLFVDGRDRAFLGQTHPIKNWWAEHDLKCIPSPSAAFVMIAEILQSMVKHEVIVVVSPSKVPSHSVSIVSTVSSVVTPKSSESDMLREYYTAVHALLKHVQVTFLSFSKPWLHTKVHPVTFSY